MKENTVLNLISLCFFLSCAPPIRYRVFTQFLFLTFILHPSNATFAILSLESPRYQPPSRAGFPFSFALAGLEPTAHYSRINSPLRAFTKALLLQSP
ncbi:hypothetical protein CBS147346_8853 [Aspergillus niger]|nr:hypothetical protein CBS147346_8853 [Aspergillus niger]